MEQQLGLEHTPTVREDILMGAVAIIFYTFGFLPSSLLKVHGYPLMLEACSSQTSFYHLVRRGSLYENFMKV